MESISDIRAKAKTLSPEDTDEFIKAYGSDTRAGVIKIIEDIEKKKDKYLKELQRIENMLIYENKYFDMAYICGIDEVGRGPLAGPVVAGAVILPKGLKIPYVNDSKKLTAKQREELSEEIIEKAVSYGIGFVSNERIDEINILQATYEAMRKAVSMLDPVPDLLLNDAVKIPGIDTTQVPIIKGDAKSLSIASASIIAKVTRDRYMEHISEKYPEYDFASNKGYGSAAHIEALKKYGPCEIHRRSFIGNFV
jgi:ribonuclease HII